MDITDAVTVKEQSWLKSFTQDMTSQAENIHISVHS